MEALSLILLGLIWVRDVMARTCPVRDVYETQDVVEVNGYNWGTCEWKFHLNKDQALVINITQVKQVFSFGDRYIELPNGTQINSEKSCLVFKHEFAPTTCSFNVPYCYKSHTNWTGLIPVLKSRRLDFTASYQIINCTYTERSTPSPSMVTSLTTGSTLNAMQSSSSNAGVIAGATIGGLLFIVLVIVGVCFIYRHKVNDTPNTPIYEDPGHVYACATDAYTLAGDAYNPACDVTQRADWLREDEGHYGTVDNCLYNESEVKVTVQNQLYHSEGPIASPTTEKQSSNYLQPIATKQPAYLDLENYSKA
uniref:Uncharacterized LOC100186433 n=1 Tax=Ciona intestinalis TaxID=7719 RepID=F6SLX6_CIOIN|nr:uncharacterized protein LOC100186433 [Ciona intestinalis]|eukprot:XP_002130816.1 uncharacterized protein LOC100186433 [Ciona intestinalis]